MGSSTDDSGITAVTVVPPAAGTTLSAPPLSRTRSRMPARPMTIRRMAPAATSATTMAMGSSG
jgi:hypothetical protein